jgi:hypothetical protein
MLNFKFIFSQTDRHTLQGPFISKNLLAWFLNWLKGVLYLLLATLLLIKPSQETPTVQLISCCLYTLVFGIVVLYYIIA